MKSRFILPLFPILLAMFMLAGIGTAEAAVSVGVEIGGGHHYSGGGVYTTVDPGYSTWYPDSSTTYVAPTVYADTSTYVYDPYVYSTPSVEFNGWYGGGGHDRDHDGGGHSERSGHSGRSGGGGGGGHRR